jgi:hypothetical protein
VAHHDPAYSYAVDALTARFEGVHPADAVLAAVERAREEIEPGATVKDFLELLVERRAREILTDRPRANADVCVDVTRDLK